jgi:hypothetical protein
MAGGASRKRRSHRSEAPEPCAISQADPAGHFNDPGTAPSEERSLEWRPNSSPR